MLGKYLIEAASGNSGGGWDISKATFVSQKYLQPYFRGLTYADNSPIGYKLFSANTANAGYYAMPVNSDNTLGSGDNVGTQPPDRTTNPYVTAGGYGLAVNPTATRLWSITNNGDYSTLYVVQNGYDLTSRLSFLQRSSHPLMTTGTRGVHISPDGNTAFVLNLSGSTWTIYKGNLSSNWNPNSASFTQSSPNIKGMINTYPSPNESVANSLYISPDGVNAYVTSWDTETQVFQYAMSTPWDVSTISFVQQRLFQNNGPLGTQRGDGITFSPDGKNMYLLTRETLNPLNNNSSYVNHFTL